MARTMHSPEAYAALERELADARTYQAAIVLENTRLFNETREALEQQTATAEVLRVISSSVADTQPVFEKILDSCRTLFDVDEMTIALVHDDGHVHIKAWRGESMRIAVRAFPRPLEETTAAQVILERRTIHVPNVGAVVDTLSPAARAVYDLIGNYSAINAPMIRDDRGIGTITLFRVPPKPFSDKEIALLTTFADQAVIAIENARLFRETQEAFERQTATSEILQVISESPTNVQPVFDAITERAMVLSKSIIGAMMRFDGELQDVMAVRGFSPAGEAGFRALWPQKLTPDDSSARAILACAPVQISDYASERGAAALVFIDAQEPIRSALSVPMIRDGRCIGTINVAHPEPGNFQKETVTLLQTFAAQAVIAIENVRLFNETKEALEQQTASAEVLRVISSSVADTAPVFEKILDSCEALFDVKQMMLILVDDEGQAHAITWRGAQMDAAARTLPRPVDQTATGLAIRATQPIHFPDAEKSKEPLPPTVRALFDQVGNFSVVFAPLLRNGRGIGSIGLFRIPQKPFTDKEIALLTTFTDQAVIAIENARLFRETQEALERQTAMSDILRVISESPTDVQPVFDAVAARAAALCKAPLGFSFRFDGELAHLVGVFGTSRESEDALHAIFPLKPDRTTLTGRVVLERVPVQVSDLRAEINYPYQQATARAGMRGFLGVPMLRDGKVIGGIGVARTEPGGFADPLVSLLQNFAAQAVIAIENVRLFNETREALEQQTASAEVLRVIASSVADAQPVLEKILDSCEALFDVNQLFISLIHDDGQLHIAAFRGQEVELIRQAYPRPLSESLTALALAAGGPLHIPNVGAELDTVPAGTRAAYERTGNSSILLAPLLRDGQGIGSIALGRNPPRPFSIKEIALLTTFADQAVIAIENARLFRETQEALERQTAMSDILRVISESPTDVQPVFDAILERAMMLTHASRGVATRFDGELLHLESMLGLTDSNAAAGRAAFPTAPTSGTLNGRAVLARAPVQIPDFFLDPDFRIPLTDDDRARSGLAVPLLREGRVLGTLMVIRPEIGTFPDQLVDVLRSFADQAVIAIENVRMFNETKEALEQQTAISDILRVTTESPTDVKPVLEVIAEHAVRLCDASSASVFLIEGDGLRHVASGGPTAIQAISLELLPIDRQSTSGRAIIDRATVQVADMHAEQAEFPRGYEYAMRLGHRSIVVAPLFREGKPFGTILLRRLDVRPFNEREVSLLRTFGDQAAIALENTRLFNETQDALARQTATADILRIISSSPTDVTPVFDAIVVTAVRLLDCDMAFVMRCDDTTVWTEVAATIDGLAPELGRVTMPLDPHANFPSRAIVDKATLHLPDWSAIQLPAHELNIRTRFGVNSTLYLPLLRHGECIGLLTLVSHRTGAFGDKEVALAESFRDQAVIAIENSRLFHEIQNKSRQLEAANRHKSEFLANMSHELRTPLNAIIGFSEVLIERMFGELNEKQDDYLKDIFTSGKHLLSLINDILDLSKIEAGRMELDLSSFEVPVAISNAMILIRERATQHGIDLSVGVAPEVGERRADERKFKQILLNLLSNAVKFTPDGGRIEVRASIVDDDVLAVAVRDSGIGIAPEDQATVFEEFKQVGRHYTNKQEGTGLGLALTKRFVELHGGTLSVQSMPGEGSTFTFTIPRQA